MRPKERQHIYRQRAADYHRLISCEDWQGNLPRALRTLCDWRNRLLVDLGTGTGRIPLLLGPEARLVVGCDMTIAMLHQARTALAGAALSCPLLAATHAALPLRPACADIAMAGWSICHAVKWRWAEHQAVLAAIMRETQRLLRPGGHLIIVETLGTGQTEPAPPDPKLDAYYALLEKEYKMARSVVRTDYRFADKNEAWKLLQMFFGTARTEAMFTDGTARCGADGCTVVEWTGIWSKAV
jgi:ubiquinone/menaquinone biosynthesis C-methylase UbiE